MSLDARHLRHVEQHLTHKVAIGRYSVRGSEIVALDVWITPRLAQLCMSRCPCCEARCIGAWLWMSAHLGRPLVDEEAPDFNLPLLDANANGVSWVPFDVEGYQR